MRANAWALNSFAIIWQFRTNKAQWYKHPL